MTNIIFNLTAALAGSLLIIYRGTLAKKVVPLNSGYNELSEEVRSKQTHLFSQLLFAFGTSILVFIFFKTLGYIEMGAALFFNVLMLSAGCHSLLSMKNFVGLHRAAFGIVAGIMFMIAAALDFSFYQSTQSVSLAINDNHLSVNTIFFGVTADLRDAKQVTIMEHLPSVSSRLNGFSLGKYQRGLYSLEDNSTAHIFAETNQPKFLNIKFNHGNDIYLNYDVNDLVQQQLVKMKNGFSN